LAAFHLTIEAVFAKSGFVFGVNSTGFDDTDISLVSRTVGIFDLVIDGIVMTPGTAPRVVSVKEIAQAGHIIVKPPFADVIA